MDEQPTFSKILRFNLLLVLGGAVAAGLLSRLTGSAILLFAFLYLGQVLVNVIIGFARLGKGAAGYFLSALLVLIIGFGSCTGLVAYLDRPNSSAFQQPSGAGWHFGQM